MTLDTRTRERSPAAEEAVPASPPLFESPGEVLVGPPFSSYGYGFRTFRPVLRLGQACFYREDYDPRLQLHKVWDAATDLDSSDQFAWMSGHEELAGEGIVEAMEVLLTLISCCDPDASTLSASALLALFRHAGHGCFSRTGRSLLLAAGRELRQAIENEADPVALEAMKEALAEFESARPWLSGGGS